MKKCSESIDEMRDIGVKLAKSGGKSRMFRRFVGFSYSVHIIIDHMAEIVNNVIRRCEKEPEATVFFTRIDGEREQANFHSHASVPLAERVYGR